MDLGFSSKLYGENYEENEIRDPNNDLNGKENNIGYVGAVWENAGVLGK